MSFFRRPFQSIVSLWSPSKKNTSPQNGSNSESPLASSINKRTASDAFGRKVSSTATSGNKKRKTAHVRSEAENGLPLEADNRSPNAESRDVMETGSPRLRQSVDRNLMPPPASKNVTHRRKSSSHKAPRISLEHADAASQATKSSRVARSEMVDEYDMEEARRKAAATQLPPNSGIWDTGERELFFHLAYRGFEPLLPKSWMIDFPTLPLSVFAHQATDIPLIQCHRSTQFRAIRALRELLDTGTSLRDRTVSSRDMRTEPILNRSAKKFISWALKDLGYPEKPSRTTIPVHTIATLQPGQSAHDVIRKLASEMHILAAKHREAANVRSSVEQNSPDALTPPRSDNEATQIHADATEEERSLPVIYGIMIASSILAIFTLNSHTPFPPFLVRALVRNQTSTLTAEKAASMNPYLPAQIQNLTSDENNYDKEQDHDHRADEDSGIRFIANFNFSNSSADVWNALVIAVLAMQIRKTMGEVFATWRQIKNESQTSHRSPRSEEDDDNEEREEKDQDESIPNPPIFDFEDSWLSNYDGIDEMLGHTGSLRTNDESMVGSVSSPDAKSKGKARARAKPKTQAKTKRTAGDSPSKYIHHQDDNDDEKDDEEDSDDDPDA